MEQFDAGLRCQDVHYGLRNVDPQSPILGALTDTRLIGMTATIAGLIRGRDVIEDAQALMGIAVQQFDVNPMTFHSLVEILKDAGYVDNIQRSGSKITSFTENVPLYDDLYQKLGDAWLSRVPTELEQKLLNIVHGLAKRPVSKDEFKDTFDLDATDVEKLIDLGDRSGLLKTHKGLEVNLIYSPFFGFENPEILNTLIQKYGSDRFNTEFEILRNKQGLELTPGQFPVINSAVDNGLIMAPSVKIPSGDARSFATLPYVIDSELLFKQKPVIDKTLAVVACLRLAENHADYNTLATEALAHVIDKLLDPNRGFLKPNSSHKRQYELLRNMGIVEFASDSRPGGSWVTPRFIDTPDNRLAMNLAKDLLTHGEILSNRIDDSMARTILDSGKSYMAPMQTLARRRPTANWKDSEFEILLAQAMGHAAQ